MCIRDRLSKDKWRMISTPARPSGRSIGGSSGGEAILVRSHAAATSFAHLALGTKGGKSPAVGCTAVVRHLSRRSLVLLSLHSWPKHGARGPNRGTLRPL
eukprot:9124370-Pyramimonas_sp.AAC.1